MKAREIARKPRVIVDPDTPATYVRALMREYDETIALIIDKKREKLEGYITWREIIQITSHYSIKRAIDLALTYPIAYSNDEIDKIVNELEKEKIYGLPIVKSKEEPILVGVTTLADIVKKLYETGYKPLAETVAETMTTGNLEEYIVYNNERVSKAWSKLVYRGKPGLIVLRSREEPVPVGILTPGELLKTGKWFFHRESEHGLKTMAKIKRIMLRGAPTATPETPIEYVARLMAENDFTVIPVIDEETKKIVGVITLYDIIKAYIEGAKPGRVKPVKKPLLPIIVKPEEKPSYISTDKILSQVLVSRKQVETLTGLTALEIARPELPAVTINDTIEHARKTMIRYKTNYLLVVDEKGGLIGVITKWNMLKALGLMGPIWRRRVYDRLFIEHIVTKDPPRVLINDSIEEVALKMVESKTEIAIVVDEHGRIQGFITKDDLIEAYDKLLRERARVENIMTPRMLGIVHPHHSLNHAIKKMTTFYIDALTVYDGSKIHGVLSANRLPFIAYEDSLISSKSKYVVWVKRVKEKGLRRARYIKVTPLLVIDAMVKLPPDTYVKTSDDVVKAIEYMKKHNIDGVPVVDEDEKVVGVVAKTDIIRELARTARLRIERGLPVTVSKKKKGRGEEESK
ncbi:MAG: CBS domain-containing protein [Desulfurococcales archaeon ex4484_58]|nr:MAG: CBS domain-containing protein [Desulfurococcales archaeon ex4484_58]